MRTTKEKLAQMKASREKNDRAERAFIDREAYDPSDRRDWMVEHFEMRLHELRAKGAPAHITERYEDDLHHLYKGYGL